MTAQLLTKNHITGGSLTEVEGIAYLESVSLSSRSAVEELLLHDAIILADEALRTLSRYLSCSPEVSRTLESVIAFPVRVLPSMYTRGECSLEMPKVRLSGSLSVLDNAFILSIDEDYLIGEAKDLLPENGDDWSISVREVATTINHERLHLLSELIWDRPDQITTNYRSYLAPDGGISGCRATKEALTELFAVISTIPHLLLESRLPESREQFDLFAYEEHGKAIRTILADRLWALKDEGQMKQFLSELFDSYLYNCSLLIEVLVDLSKES